VGVNNEIINNVREERVPPKYELCAAGNKLNMTRWRRTKSRGARGALFLQLLLFICVVGSALPSFPAAETSITHYSITKAIITGEKDGVEFSWCANKITKRERPRV
jgi:hypothetical protein